MVIMKMPDGYKLVIRESEPHASMSFRSMLYAPSGAIIDDLIFSDTEWGAKTKAKRIACKHFKQSVEGKFEATYYTKDGKWQKEQPRLVTA